LSKELRFIIGTSSFYDGIRYDPGFKPVNLRMGSSTEIRDKKHVSCDHHFFRVSQQGKQDTAHFPCHDGYLTGWIERRSGFRSDGIRTPDSVRTASGNGPAGTAVPTNPGGAGRSSCSAKPAFHACTGTAGSRSACTTSRH
jgi:hypothetical protein